MTHFSHKLSNDNPFLIIKTTISWTSEFGEAIMQGRGMTPKILNYFYNVCILKIFINIIS